MILTRRPWRCKNCSGLCPENKQQGIREGKKEAWHRDIYVGASSVKLLCFNMAAE